MDAPEEILVGYDGSAEAVPALRWAARQAVLRGWALHLVHSTLWPALTHDLGPVPGIAGSGLRSAAEDILADGVERIHADAPQLAVTSTLLYGWAAEHLRDLSSTAGLLVVGTRGAGGFMGLLIGSVSLDLAATAECPVAVVRAGEHPDGPVVVGLDIDDWESPLRHACTLAALSHVPLRAVHVRKVFRLPGIAAARPATSQDNPDTEVRALLDSAERVARGTFPGLDIQSSAVTGASIPGSLLAQAKDASIVVLGTKGRGMIRGTVGSTAHAVLHHAKCPVLLVRERVAAVK